MNGFTGLDCWITGIVQTMNHEDVFALNYVLMSDKAQQLKADPLRGLSAAELGS